MLEFDVEIPSLALQAIPEGKTINRVIPAGILIAKAVSTFTEYALE